MTCAFLVNFTKPLSRPPKSFSHGVRSIRNRTITGLKASYTRSNVSVPEKVQRKPPNHSPLQWNEQWYAIAVVEDIPNHTPFTFTLFSKKYVLVRDSNRDFVAESCSGIDESMATAVECGIVWVFPSTTVQADVSKIPLPRTLRDGRGCVMTSMVREVPCAFETLMENLVDSAHVYFAHHNARPEWRRDSSDIQETDDKIRPPDDSFRTTSDGSFDVVSPKRILHFRAPTVVMHEERTGSVSTLFFCSPVDARTSRFVLSLVGVQARATLRWVFRLVPRPSMHASSHVIVDGDTVMLCGIERALGDHSKWRTKYGVQAGIWDGPVYRYRAYMDKHREAMPNNTGTLSISRTAPRISREVMLDRYHTHTKQCKHCSQALGLWRIVEMMARIVLWLVGNTIVSLVGLGLFANPSPVSQFVMKWVGSGMVAIFFVFIAIRKYALTGISDLTYTEKARRLFESP